MILVDTSVWIDFLNGQPSSEAGRLTHAISEGEPIAMAGIVLTEILMGLRSDAEASKVGNLLRAFDLVSEPSVADYEEAARIYRACRAQGITVRSTIDCLIARLAIRDKLPLLTKDRDFEGIARHAPLQLVSTI